MKMPMPTLRVRIFLFFALIALAAPTSTGIAIWLSSQANELQATRLQATYVSLAALLLMLLTLLIWQLFDRHVASALQSLARDMQTALHTDKLCPPNTEQLRYLGPVSSAASELMQAAHELRMQASDQQRNLDSQLETRQMASILYDLDIGVLVMNLQFEILLYNRCAFGILSGANPDCRETLGLGRLTHELMNRAPLEQAAQQLHSNIDSHCVEKSVKLTLNFSLGEQHTPIHGKLTLTRNDAEIINGYVLIIDTPEPSDDPKHLSTLLADPTLTTQSEYAARHQQTNDEEGPTAPFMHTVETVPPARPEFYDFNLFDRVLPENLLHRPLVDSDFVVFDTETTGLQPSNGDEIISIGAVRIVNGRVLKCEYFNELVHPGRLVPERSIVFHGITDEMLEGKPNINTVLPRFARFVGSSILVAHNAAFDMKFLELKSEQCQVHLENPVLDTVLLSAWLHDHTHKHTLDDLAKRFGIDINGRHSAFGDALATAEVFVKLLGQLASRNILTLDQALTVSEQMTHIKRHQKSY